MRMQSGMQGNRAQQFGKYEYEDKEGNLFWQYHIIVNSLLSTPLPEIRLTGCSQVRHANGVTPSNKHWPRSTVQMAKLGGECEKLNHNRQKCTQYPLASIETIESVAAMQETPILATQEIQEDGEMPILALNHN